MLKDFLPLGLFGVVGRRCATSTAWRWVEFALSFSRNFERSVVGKNIRFQINARMKLAKEVRAVVLSWQQPIAVNWL